MSGLAGWAGWVGCEEEAGRPGGQASHGSEIGRIKMTKEDKEAGL